MTVIPTDGRSTGVPASISTLLLSSLILLFVGCNKKGDDHEVEILRWADPHSKMSIVLLLRERGIKNVSILRIDHPSKHIGPSEKMLDDDVRLGTVRFIEVADWIVVTNGPYALGGYNRKSGRLIGEYEWSQLPFLVWNGHEGRILAIEERVQTSDASKPAGYPSNANPDEPS